MKNFCLEVVHALFGYFFYGGGGDRVRIFLGGVR